MSAEEAKAYGLIDEIFVGKDSLISLAKEAEPGAAPAPAREPVTAR
jgi:enoyl-CoA hydratase/carnithine racemase